eukprot:1159815-Pelagomonas_calceolata.AAC.11
MIHMIAIPHFQKVHAWNAVRAPLWVIVMKGLFCNDPYDCDASSSKGAYLEGCACSSLGHHDGGGGGDVPQRGILTEKLTTRKARITLKTPLAAKVREG